MVCMSVCVLQLAMHAGVWCVWVCVVLAGKEESVCKHVVQCCVGVCMAPGCCMSPGYACVHNVGVWIAGSSVGKGVTEEEERKRVC